MSFYPRFKYNAVGGGGWGTVTDLGDGKLHLNFDTSVLVIPDMSYRTATLMGLLPMPPPLNIAIKPVSLEVGGLEVGGLLLRVQLWTCLSPGPSSGRAALWEVGGGSGGLRRGSRGGLHGARARQHGPA